MPVNATNRSRALSDLENVEKNGKEKVSQLIMRYHVAERAPVVSQIDIPATGSTEGAVVSVFNFSTQLTDHEMWNLTVKGERFPPIASARPKGCDAGKAKFNETYVIQSNRLVGDRVEQTGQLRADKLYTDTGTGVLTSASTQILPIRDARGRFLRFAHGFLKITYKEDGSRVMVATATMNKTDIEKNGEPMEHLRNTTPMFAKDR
jgi:hypothetical protein